MVRATGATAIAVTLMLAAPAPGADRLAEGAEVVAPLAPGEPVRLTIDTPAGTYLAGRIEAGTLPLDADLLDATGGHVRRIAQADSGTIEFQSVTDGPAMQVQLVATSQGEVVVALDRVVPPEDQHAPAPAFLSPRIAALAAEVANGAGTDDFWRIAAAEGTPLIEDDGGEDVLMTFLWRGAQRNVRLFGAPSNDHEWLERLGDSDVWFKSFRVPRDTRLSYKLAPDIPDFDGTPRARRVALLATAQMDPLNRHPWPADAPDRFNQHATVTLPGAPEQPGTPPAPDADPVIERMTFASGRLGNSREVLLSYPRDLDPGDPRLVVALLTDGRQALSLLDAPRVLDTLTRDGRLPPVVAVLIPAIDNRLRQVELPGNPAFADALADELLPQVAARLGITPDPARTVMAGASYGGLAAATAALRRPDRIGNVLSMSGSFWWAPEGAARGGLPHVAMLYAAQDRLPIRFALSVGRFETARDGRDGIVESNMALADILRLRGYPVMWRDYAGGHDQLVWRGALADGLIALFGTPAAAEAAGGEAEASLRAVGP